MISEILLVQEETEETKTKKKFIQKYNGLLIIFESLVSKRKKKKDVFLWLD